MKPHTMTALGLKLLAEFVILVESSPKLREDKRLTELAGQVTDLLSITGEPRLPRSQAMRAAMRVAADGVGKMELMQLVRAIKVAASIKSDRQLVNDLMSEKKKKKTRRLRVKKVAAASLDNAAA